MLSDTDLDYLASFASMQSTLNNAKQTGRPYAKYMDALKKLREEYTMLRDNVPDEPPKLGPRPKVCSHCEKPVIKLPTGKWACNCTIYHF